MKEFKDAMRIVRAEQSRNKAYSELRTIKKRIKSLTESLEDTEPVKYTGFYVLLKRIGDKYEFLRIFNPDFDEDEPEWDLALPIPENEFLPEFEGW